MLYKYLSPERIDVIQNMKIRFTPVVSLNDPFEFSMMIGNAEYQVDPRCAKNCTKFLSLSRNNSNILMWSHYADCHQGFVIGFDRSHPYFSEAQSVRYRRLRSSFNGAKISDIQLGEITRAVALEKAVDWAYEEEERLFLDESATEIYSVGTDFWGQEVLLRSIPIDSIKEIYLGVRSSSALLADVREVNFYHGGKINVYKAKMSKTHFGIDFYKLD